MIEKEQFYFAAVQNLGEPPVYDILTRQMSRWSQASTENSIQPGA